ncbi:hypothetical protein [Paraburkholderia tropica]|uniref:hypothetical protein n=1 Tax=Paraburkholderia tropica TaxID=92647 RepID=UPI002AB78C48|nr:hypothetical protein [Paraburkholderia tropica]
MEQEWFELREARRRTLTTSSWVPLRASITTESGEYAYLGWNKTYFGLGSVACAVEDREHAQELGWMDAGISHSHGPDARGDEYHSVELYRESNDFVGLNLVLEQPGFGSKDKEWHLNQDLVIALGLFREGDVWVRPSEGYVEVAKLTRNLGRPCELKIRTEYLKDYLAARKMGLFTSIYTDRDEILADVSHIKWEGGKASVKEDGIEWEGIVMPIHAGNGHRFGSETAVFHIANSSEARHDDVPAFSFPAGDNAKSRQWRVKAEGDKLFRVIGKLWKSEWIAPADRSPRVRRDPMPATVYFLTDASGKRESRDTLAAQGRWLWFKPDVVNALLRFRDSRLLWYTQDTGEVGANADSTVHFGINALGLVNVYAKDMGLLDDWQQQVWAAYTVAPEGGVSEELWASQMDASPVETQAPEKFLPEVLEFVNLAFEKHYGTALFRPHQEYSDIVGRCHRFRGLDQEGLLALAKDLARLTADSIDAQSLQKIVSPPKGEKWGSLKSLEKVVATLLPEERAREITGPLFGTYDLRLADAHLAGKDLSQAYESARIDRERLHIFQSWQLLDSFVRSLATIGRAVEKARKASEASGVAPTES